jgi:peptide/nickel transport system permease protein
VALFYLSFQWGVFPLRHAYSDTLSPSFSLDFLWSVIVHLFLPAVTIIVVSIGGWLLGMRNTMISTLAEDYVTMAEAKGLPQSRVMFRYAARNALLPNMTAFGMSLGFILGGALFTEVVFAYPGLGYLIYNSIRQSDFPVVQGSVLLLVVSVAAANLLLDLVNPLIDPRIRAARS